MMTISIRELISIIKDYIISILKNDTYYFTNYTGSSNISETIENPSTSSWEVVEIRLHLSDLGGGNNLIVNMDSGTGEEYDFNLITEDMTYIQDFRDNDINCILESNDTININWDNSSNRTYGLTVITRERL